MNVSVSIVKKFLICCLHFSGCTGLIEYSPYDTPVETLDLNITESGKIPKDLPPSDTFKFALISDTHEFYDDMAEAIRGIHTESNIQFIACSGDVTTFGLANEFEWYMDEVKKSTIPFITVIGNHDYRSNGYNIFKSLFGPPNMSFVSGKYKFILFDDVLVENDYVSPRYEWLIDELSDNTHYNILLCHLPPASPEMAGFHNILFREIVTQDNTILCLHGHASTYIETYYNGIHTLVSTKISLREYYIISLIGNQSIVKRVHF